MFKDDKAPETFFFYQLLHPFHDTSHNGIENDPKFTPTLPNAAINVYDLFELGLGGDYGHHFHLVSLLDLVQWDGSMFKDGVCGRSCGAIMLRFDKCPDNTAFDKEISESFMRSRWLEIKRFIKLCNNVSALQHTKLGMTKSIFNIGLAFMIDSRSWRSSSPQD